MAAEVGLASNTRVFQSPKYIQGRGTLKRVGQYVRGTFPAAKRAAVVLPPILRQK